MDSYMMRNEQRHEARRVRRRVLFTLHVALVVLLNLGYTLWFAPNAYLLAINSVLLTTIFVHAGWLYMIGLYDSTLLDTTRRVHLTLAELAPQPVPLLTDGERSIVQSRATPHDFWFRWHDLG